MYPASLNCFGGTSYYSFTSSFYCSNNEENEWRGFNIVRMMTFTCRLVSLTHFAQLVHSFATFFAFLVYDYIYVPSKVNHNLEARNVVFLLFYGIYASMTIAFVRKQIHTEHIILASSYIKSVNSPIKIFADSAHHNFLASFAFAIFVLAKPLATNARHLGATYIHTRNARDEKN